MEKLKQDSSGNIPHLRKSGKAIQLIVDGKPFIMLAGEVHNSSSSSLAYMQERVWYRLRLRGKPQVHRAKLYSYA
jgi:hypothetical protein